MCVGTKWKDCVSSKVFVTKNTVGFDWTSDQVGDTRCIMPFFQAAVPNKLEVSEHS